jgi:large subunit ribosomal protein L18
MQNARRINRQRKRRGKRVRNSLKRVALRPRLCVFRSHNNFYAQIIDDQKCETVASAGTLEKEMRASLKYGGNKIAAAAIGKLIAQRALEKGIKEVYLDRREYKYHGRVAAMADAAREAGLVL